jgi:hypothetical protein
MTKTSLIVDYDVTNAPLDSCQLDYSDRCKISAWSRAFSSPPQTKASLALSRLRTASTMASLHTFQSRPLGVGFVRRSGIPTMACQSLSMTLERTFVCPAGQVLRFRYIDHIPTRRTYVLIAIVSCLCCQFLTTKCTTNKRNRRQWR